MTDKARTRCEDAANHHAEAKAWNADVVYAHIARTLARDYTDMFYVNLDSEEFIEYCRDAEGNYRITGRLKDMIIRGGENIYPKEIEEFIYTHPAVRDVQVIGVPDKRYGEEILAAIILKEPGTVTVEEMTAYIRASMARHKVPRYIEFVESFPMNAAGKILKYKMREDAVKRLGLEHIVNKSAEPVKK